MGRNKVHSDVDIAATAHLPLAQAAALLGTSSGRIWERRQRLSPFLASRHSAFVDVEIEDGVLLVGSDCHYWPGDPSTAHRAFVRFCSTLKPALVILNGDVVDAATISRFPEIGWENKPDLVDEIGTAQARLWEIFRASASARHIWTLGNHDMRFEMRLAQTAPEFAQITGVHLRDHFPDWEPAWEVRINGIEAIVKHRFRGGLHAPYNNTVKAGTSMVTGHLHSLQVTRFSDYRGDRWGVDGGTMAVPYGPQFINYTEANPVDWASGFVVLTFDKGRLLWPEVVHVVDETAGAVCFRGQLMEV